MQSRALATPATGPELAAFNWILSLDAMADMAEVLYPVYWFESKTLGSSLAYYSALLFHLSNFLFLLFSKALGKTADVASYRKTSGTARTSFHKRFYNASVGAWQWRCTKDK